MSGVIECALCSKKLPDDAVYDNYPCPVCGKSITCFMTKADGTKISQRQYLRDLAEVMEGP